MGKILLFVTLGYLFATALACCPDDSKRDELTEANQSTDTGSLDEKAPAPQLVSAQIQTYDQQWVDITSDGKYTVSDAPKIQGKIRIPTGETIKKLTLTVTYQGGIEPVVVPLKPSGHTGSVYSITADLCPPSNKKRFTVSEASITVTTNKKVSIIAVPSPLHFTIKS